VLTHSQARSLIQERLGLAASGEGPLLAVEAPPDRWLALGRLARTELGCVYMSFLSAVDWKEQGLEVVARVENLDAGFALMMKCKLGAGETRCPSLVSLWRGADWMERECYDMFGVVFDGHPDLRRILLSQDWEGYPLRKDYAVDTPYSPYR
jgi:NADH-quinone oxidoreductase subunit C